MTDEQIKALAELKKLLDAGVLTETEFHKQKTLVFSAATTSDTPKGETAHPEKTSGKENVWIISGVVAVVLVIIVILLSSGGNNSPSRAGYDYPVAEEYVDEVAE